MFAKLLILFIVIPILELALLIKIGTMIGTLNTIALVILTAFIGAYMVRIEGLNILYRFQENLARGTLPAEEIFDGAMVLVAGAFLLTPGIITDIVGFLFVFPSSRRVIKKVIRDFIEKKMSGGHINITRF
ncbi:MAG: FxsA family protein [Thermodesulfobacteriota bacterium]